MTGAISAVQEVQSLKEELHAKDALIGAHIQKLLAWRQELAQLQAMQSVVVDVCALMACGCLA